MKLDVNQFQLTENQQSLLVQSEQELAQFWSRALSQIQSKKLLILLDGDLGAGKTTSVQNICDFLQLEEAASPSFAISHSYQGKNKFQLHHVDLYRIESEEDLESTGFWDVFAQDNWVVVEWALRVSDQSWPLGWPVLRVKIEKNDPAGSSSQRLVHFQFGMLVA